MAYLYEDNPIIKKTYEENSNYTINLSVEKEVYDYCFIYFSSNNLYFPNNDETFKKTIVESDRYEWKRNCVKKDSNKTYKEIFVRDVYKSWYVLGINKDINSLESLVSLLRELTTDCKEIITVGNSAGGYAACYVGMLLSAKRIFNFCGQFSLSEEMKQNDILTKHISDDLMDISGLVNTTKINMIYIYSGKCKSDIDQVNLIDSKNEVRKLKFKSKIHGRTVYKINMPKLLAMDDSEIDQIYVHYNERMISPLVFSFKISGLKETIMYLLHMMKKKLFKG